MKKRSTATRHRLSKQDKEKIFRKHVARYVNSGKSISFNRLVKDIMVETKLAEITVRRQFREFLYHSGMFAPIV